MVHTWADVATRVISLSWPIMNPDDIDLKWISNSSLAAVVEVWANLIVLEMSILIKDFLFFLKRSPGPKKYELVTQDEHPIKVKNIVIVKPSFATAFFKLQLQLL